MIALVRPVSPRIVECQLQHRQRVPISYPAAVREHAQYVQALEQHGCAIVPLPALDAHPDGCFVEDNAVVVDNVAVICRLGAAERRGEERDMEQWFRTHGFDVRVMPAPATLDGGDVLQVGDQIFAGLSKRTNRAGVDFLRSAVQAGGRPVHPVEVTGVLHLKSACTWLGGSRLMACLDKFGGGREVLQKFDVIRPPPGEELAADLLKLGDVILVPAHCPQSAARLRELGMKVFPVEIQEIEKAEAGLTCMSVLVDTLP